MACYSHPLTEGVLFLVLSSRWQYYLNKCSCRNALYTQCVQGDNFTEIITCLLSRQIGMCYMLYALINFNHALNPNNPNNC